jgi:CelD/BcsL family acetyltransferase involved in cellulose biosynthesis
LRLWFAEIGGQQVAAWYGWRFAGAEWYYQAGRDPRWDNYSLGFVTLVHTVREACRDGVSAYHFLAGPDTYKWRFAQEDPGAESRLLSSGPIAGIASLAVRAADTLPASARQRVLRMANHP